MATTPPYYDTTTETVHEGGAEIPAGSRRVAPTRPIRPRSSPRSRTVEPLPEMLTLGQVEERMVRCDDRLDELVEEYAQVSEERAEAESVWKEHRDRVLVMLADSSEDKEAADIREARAMRAHVTSASDSPLGKDLYRTYKIKQAHEQSVDRSMRALQTRMNGLMSLARGLRNITGLDD